MITTIGSWMVLAFLTAAFFVGMRSAIRIVCRQPGLMLPGKIASVASAFLLLWVIIGFWGAPLFGTVTGLGHETTTAVYLSPLNLIWIFVIGGLFLTEFALQVTRNLGHTGKSGKCQICADWEHRVEELYGIEGGEIGSPDKIAVLESLCSEKMANHLPDWHQEQFRRLRQMLQNLRAGGLAP